MVKKDMLDYSSMRVRDMTSLPSRRLRIRGSFAYVTAEQRSVFGGTEYLLVREPQNRHDANAIAVYGRQRKIGYVAARTAATMCVWLDQLDGDGFVVKGTSTLGDSIRLWVDLPSIPALRDYVANNS
jgi:hypothetical protein